VLVVAAVLVGCGGSGSDEDSAEDTVPATTVVEETTVADDPVVGTTLPPGATAGLDDYDGNGEPDPTCGTQDFGAGLVLRIPCEIGTASEPEQGTRLVEGSLYRLPGSTDINLDGVSGSIVLARDDAGRKVAVFINNSSALFETGSAAIGEPETLDGTIRVVNERFARGRIQVRGHTDSTGSAAANQTLSEQRAASVRDYLRDHGVDATEVTSVGLGSSRPLTEEREADGSPDPEGMRFNRRVEIVIRYE
jgi:outer membrane protein OmpA-like peptidoglycan-associated protein